MRAARLISLMLLLQARGSMTGAELSKELEVSERTVARDVLALAESGVPIYAERGRNGGYRLLDGYRSKLTGLDRDEAEAVFLGAIPGPAAELGLAEAAAAARLKVAAALAPTHEDAPTRVNQRFHLDAPRWFRDAPPATHLPELARAVWTDQWIRAEYQGTARTSTPELKPYGLVLKAGVWYLIAQRQDRFLVYRVDRFRSIDVLDESFERDNDFDLSAFWAQHSAEFASSLLVEQARVRLSPAGRRSLPQVIDAPAVAAAEASVGEPDDQGWVTATVPIESIDVAYDQLLRLGPEVEVLTPVPLRERLADTASRLLAVYV